MGRLCIGPRVVVVSRELFRVIIGGFVVARPLESPDDLRAQVAEHGYKLIKN